jgi:outer membrane immunogenic protein
MYHYLNGSHVYAMLEHQDVPMIRKSLAAGALCVFALSQPARAEPPGSWSGLYVGLHAGYLWGNSRFAWTPDPGFPDPNTLLPARVAASAATLKPAGLIGGFGLGYNVQSGQIVAGVEADLGLLNARADRLVNPVSVGVNGTVSESTSIAALSTFRGRLGFAVDRYLVYATGGLALGRVTQSMVQTYAAVLPANGTRTTWQAGWTIGAGIEARLGGGWTAKAEYLYADLGSTRIFAASPDFISAAGTSQHRLTTSTVRVGVNYLFGQ